MIQLRTILTVADNSGAKKLRVMQLPGFSKKHVANLGDVVKATVMEAIPTGQVKKSEKVNVLIVRTKKEVRRKDGSYVRFGDNAGVVINAGGLPMGSRIFGPVAREIKELGYNKIASLAKEVV
ncbi:MAG: 50S ribosomal protein L14 [Candidatus Shapirobacteria bacterium]|nr:50S ribosomal protein L14 [Candidatus Shapirobacteria bacterium]MDD5073923.1 50S ribosomal protein L14 [Candidatus Shapirobacteria bacterium]MDD5481561.1 50S ribosomal protein L14 [Candidatus Shapirobacteria bacterium]